ncbi:MAG: hypothetical protein IPN70_05035 [Candidatus Moraniibacteriota bacterium]|nr:MAG: hypothetical protein IPN70_05035 [Candidatus Moranbacteria bacterium]
MDLSASERIQVRKAEKSQSLSLEKKKKISEEPTNSLRKNVRKRSGGCKSLSSVKKEYSSDSRTIKKSWMKIDLSFYHPTGSCTASGAVMDPNSLTVAVDSRFPLGSMLEIRDPKTGKSVRAFASDRCPKRSCTRKNRVDATVATFLEIGGNVERGLKSVEVRMISAPG